MEGNKEKSCKDCPDRKLHCHATCEHHARRLERNKQMNEERRKRVAEEGFYRAVHSHNGAKGRWK